MRISRHELQRARQRQHRRALLSAIAILALLTTMFAWGSYVYEIR